MREILFKAKDKDDDIWYEGYYVCLHDTTYCFAPSKKAEEENTHHYIVFEQMTDWNLPNRHFKAEILPETLCQWTGLNDKNGKKIWENDICDRKEKFTEIVKMHKGDWTLDYSHAVGKENCYCNLGFYVCERKSVEVIGNIFDNPELVGCE